MATTTTTQQQQQQDNHDTYEATRARQSTRSLPDKITWTRASAFRDQPYRLLHHQECLIGKFRVQLLEAASLKRSYWSALALGPVKHLGLSKAHGPISSFASFGLAFEDGNTHNNSNVHKNDWNQKKKRSKSIPGWNPQSPKSVVQSPVVPQNDNPVWQSCEFELPLGKGAMPRDGMSIVLQVRMDEDASAAEHMLPMGVPSPDERLLGTGSLDLTPLCLGITKDGRQEQASVMDVWVPLELKKQESDEEDSILLYHTDEKKDALKQQPQEHESTGRVRVLVTYRPHGLEPRHNDWVAMEAFARRCSIHNGTTPLVPPLAPFRVLDIRGSHLLVEYTLPNKSAGKKAAMRLHRNAVFVVERQNVMDGMVNAALLPTDVFLSTSLGQSTARVAAPVLNLLGELVLPAVLTLKIVTNVAKTTAMASVSGVSAATGAAVAAATSSTSNNSHKKNPPSSFRQESFV